VPVWRCLLRGRRNPRRNQHTDCRKNDCWFYHDDLLHESFLAEEYHACRGCGLGLCETALDAHQVCVVNRYHSSAAEAALIPEAWRHD
jgi:hypothetical protein